MKIALINPTPGTHVGGQSGDIATIRGFEWIFQNIVTSILSFAGIVLFLMLIVGGFKFMTSGGNPESAAAAQKTITYAVFGIVLIAVSFLILVLIENFTGANITVFEVYKP